MSFRPAAFNAVLTLVLISGCGNYVHGPVSVQGNWPELREKNRRIVILPVRWANEEEFTPKVRTELDRAVNAAFEQVKSHERVDANPLLEALGQPDATTPISDLAIVEAARKLGIDEVVFVSVHEYVARLEVGIFPPWVNTVSNISYDLRLLDVPSGNLLVQSAREGWYHDVSLAKLCDDLPKNLTGDLVVLLRSNPRPPQAQVASAEVHR